MQELLWILISAAAVVAAAVVYQQYRAQHSAMWRVLQLILALTERQYARRTDPSGRGTAGELARAANGLAENLEGLSAKAQQDSDHLLSLLAVLDHTNEIALATDASDNIRLANPAAARVLGRSADQLLGKPLEAVIVHPELQSLFRSAFHSAKPVSAPVTLETTWGGGRTLYCQATAATIYNGSHYRGTLLLLRDITEIARTLQIKTDFVANASHELRTPVASIRAAVDTVKESAADGEELDARTTRRCIDIIHDHATRLEMIITDLLDLSRAEEPGAAVRTGVDLAQVCEQAMATFASKAGEKHLQLRVELAPDARSIKGDARLLLLTLNNLVDNAIKFTNAGSVTIRSYVHRGDLPADHLPQVRTTLPFSETAPPRSDHSVVLEVQDTGCGIAAEDQQRVFERFYTVNRSRGGAGRGTGLGLAIVKHAVAAMGGQVALLSTIGKGTTLRCYFPQETPAAVAAAPSADAVPAVQ